MFITSTTTDNIAQSTVIMGSSMESATSSHKRIGVYHDGPDNDRRHRSVLLTTVNRGQGRRTRPSSDDAGTFMGRERT